MPAGPSVPVPPEAEIATTRELFEPPGGILMWLVVALELFAFGIVFGLVANLRATEPEIFARGRDALDWRMGIALTISLVTSGYFAAEAVHAYRGGRIAATRRFYGGAIAAGLLFVGLKLYDYGAKANAGHSLAADSFWDAYFLATGFHFAHVLVGLFLLSYAALRVGGKPFEDEETSVAGTALFWHMCDVAWFFLFPLFYARH